MAIHQSVFSQKKALYILEKFDPLSKLIALVCLAIVAIRTWNPMVLAIMFLAGVMITLVGTGMGWRRLGRRMVFIFGLAVPLFALTALSSVGGGEQLSFGPIVVTESGLINGAAVALRMLVLFISSFAYIESTEPKDFVDMMAQRLKLPYRFVFGISMAMTFLPLLEQEARISRAAHTIRIGGAPRGARARLRQRKAELASIFIGAIRRVQQTSGAMDGKGFGAYPERTYLREVNMNAPGYVLSVASIAGLLLLIVV